MRHAGSTLRIAVAAVFCTAACLAAQTASSAASQAAAAPASAEASAPSAQVEGGRLHGVVKSGNIPLPGVTVTAQNTLTGKRFSTTTDITGAWSLTIPQNGRYVIHTQFAAFAPGDQEVLLNATGHDRTVNFELILASRAAAQEQQQAQQGAAGIDSSVAQAIQQLGGNGAESLQLMNALSADTDTGGGMAGAAGADLPSIAGNADFGGDSVAINGQSGQVSPLAGLDVNRIRDAIEQMRLQGGGPGGRQLGMNGVPVGGAGAAGLFGGGILTGPGGMMGPGGGGFGGGRGGFGGGRRGFRGFNPAQPHGAVFWDGSNSALNAEPFALRGQSQLQPASGSNRFGLTFISAPYIPGLTKPSGKDTLFLSLSGQRSASPQDFYGTVPTLAQRAGDFSGTGEPAIYDPATGQQFTYLGRANVMPPTQIASQATALLNYFPQPNLAGASAVNNYNYHLLTTQQQNSTQAGVRYMRSLGANAATPGMRGFGGFGRRGGSVSQGLRQSISFRYNWAHSASDQVNLFPQLGGKTASDSIALQAGYTVGYHRFTSISNVGWNRSSSNIANFFTNTAENAGNAAGILVPNQAPLNYGLPSVTLSNFTGLREVQPSFSIEQTITFSEVLSWSHGKHNLRFGGDYHRVHHDFLAGSNATGAFTFTGLFTQQTASGQPVPDTGSSLADFLLGFPQSTTLNSSLAKSYLRENVIDAFAMDDWRIARSFTVNYGVRYEYFAPYTEKYGRLAEVLTNPEGGFTTQTEVVSGTAGLPASLVYPVRTAFSPRVGFAVRLPKSTVLRADFGMNYTVGEYATFAATMAHQPPFTNQQTNQAAVGNVPSTACVQTNTCFTLANGFPAAATVGNFALDLHYGLPYVETWNLDVQKTLPWGIVMNVGYTGSRANHLDLKSAPRATPSSPGTNPTSLIFNYDQAAGFYKMNAGTLRLNKRFSHGIAMGANYQYGHAIDSASSVNGSNGTVAQNWQDLSAEEGNSSLDVRHRVTGTYVYELPFGEGRMWATSGKASHILDGFSVSGSFTFASGTWLTPVYTPTAIGVACGTAGSLRADHVPGVSLTAGGGSLRQWFNPNAYALPSATPGYCNAYGSAPRNSIEGPGTVENNMALAKTVDLGDTRSLEMRATINNVFNTVQYTGVNTTAGTPTFAQVSSAGSMRAFQFTARFRF